MSASAPGMSAEATVLTLNILLRLAGIDPKTVHLARHQDRRYGTRRTPYALWRRDLGLLEAYQSVQARQVFRVGNVLASFVVTPADQTLFVGLYRIDELGTAPAGLIDPSSQTDVGGQHLYTLTADDRLKDYSGKLVIEWATGFRSWVQRAWKKDKRVLEIHGAFREEAFPGLLRFMRQLSEIESMPLGWIERLNEARGVYLLTCPKTGEWYVGSATGAGGFNERWLQHAAKGGDAAKFKDCDPSDLQVSVLEVAGSGASSEEIVRNEHLWIRKLSSVQMG